MTRSKFDNYLDTFDLTGTKPYSNDVILPVADTEQNFRFDTSRSRDVRPCLNDVPVPVHSSLPEEDVDPHVVLPDEEDVQVQKLQRNVDNSPSVRPKESGRNLSIPPVHYTKSKIKQKSKDSKKPSNKKGDDNETEYLPSVKIKPGNFEILPKNLRSRRVPGFSPKLQDIKEISQEITPVSDMSLPQDNSDHLQNPSIVNNESISNLQKDLGKLILKLKKVPGTQEYVSYQDIKKFPQDTEEE